ncbi:hypothetical protein UFOVP75_224 [uncultured Caudovirales phage]|uniref:Uncharacterized protein n=1 Tax=uncultured Caudovirales phage TaxID=2100421 RepID=A0A6J5L2Q8_9CAUD|nr:hypothetical protein UFOVP75_224 [uncultured Caudovirales phage]
MNEWTTTTPTKPGHYYFSVRPLLSHQRYHFCVTLGKDGKFYHEDGETFNPNNFYVDRLWIKQPTLDTFFNAIKRFLRIP